VIQKLIKKKSQGRLKSLPPRSSAGNDGIYNGANLTSLDPITENYKMESQSEIDPELKSMIGSKPLNQ
jgi:hypothetical protein